MPASKTLAAANHANRREPQAMIDSDTSGARRHDVPSIKQAALYDFLTSRARDAASLKPEVELAFAAEVRPALDLARLSRAYSRVLLRHGELRAVFHRQGSNLRVDRLEPERFRVLDLDALDWSDDEVLRDIQNTMSAGFPSLAEPLTRLTVYRRSDDSVVIFCRIHHLVADAWSLDLFFRDMMALYFDDRADQSGKDNAENFEDYVDWEEEFVASPEGSQSRKFWRETIVKAAARVPLPYDRQPGDAPISKCGTTKFVIESDVLRSVDRMATRLSTTRFVILLASFALMIARATGARCIPIGVMSSRRQTRARSELIGDLAQAIYVLIEPPVGEAGDDFFARVSGVVGAAQAHENLPIEPVIDELLREGLVDLRTAGFRQLAFSGWTPQLTDPFGFGAFLHDIPGRKIRIAGYTAMTIELSKQGCSRDIRLNYSVDSDRLQLSILYNADRFDQPTIERMARDYHALVVAIAAPDRM